MLIGADRRLIGGRLGSALLQGCAALLTLDVTDNSIRSGLDHLRHVPRLQVLLLGGELLQRALQLAQNEEEKAKVK